LDSHLTLKFFFSSRGTFNPYLTSDFPNPSKLHAPLRIRDAPFSPPPPPWRFFFAALFPEFYLHSLPQPSFILFDCELPLRTSPGPLLEPSPFFAPNPEGFAASEDFCEEPQAHGTPSFSLPFPPLGERFLLSNRKRLLSKLGSYIAFFLDSLPILAEFPPTEQAFFFSIFPLLLFCRCCESSPPPPGP